MRIILQRRQLLAVEEAQDLVPGKVKKAITIRIDVDLYEKLPRKKAEYIEQLIRKDLS